MPPHFDDISENSRSLLIKESIKLLRDRGHSINTEGRREAADVIVESKARGYLTKEHLSDILDLTTTHRSRCQL